MNISRLCLEVRRQLAIDLEIAGLLETDSLEVKVRALLAERRQRIGYERELAVVADACR